MLYGADNDQCDSGKGAQQRYESFFKLTLIFTSVQKTTAKIFQEKEQFQKS